MHFIRTLALKSLRGRFRRNKVETSQTVRKALHLGMDKYLTIQRHYIYDGKTCQIHLEIE